MRNKFKTILNSVTLLCLSVLFITIANDTKAQGEKVLSARLEAIPEGEILSPKYPGEESALVEFIRTEVTYPAEAKKAKQTGTVVVSFVVDTSGKVTESKVFRSVNKLLDAEALRVVNAMPIWTPGKKDGVAVPVELKLPITFELPKE